MKVKNFVAISMVALILLSWWNDLGSAIFKKHTHTIEENYISIVKQLHNEGCNNSCEIMDKIIEYYTRDSWWDFKLCSEKKYDPIHSNISTLMPLKTFNKDAWANKDPSKNIFFIENNCKTTIEFYVMCSLESAAVLNPDATVFLLTVIPFLEDSSGEIRNLLGTFLNIKILQADYDNLLQDTPLNAFKNSEIWTKIPGYLKAHVSDLMRVALIWKEGGTYLDSDTISVKKLPSEEHALTHGKKNIFNGFIKASKKHEYLLTVMNYQKTAYNPNSWESIGSDAITKGVNIYCNMTSYKPGMCKDVLILPINSFTPVIWDEVEKIMKSHSTLESKVLLKFSYGIHTHHYAVGHLLNELGNDSLYDKITKEFCPISYKNTVTKNINS